MSLENIASVVISSADESESQTLLSTNHSSKRLNSDENNNTQLSQRSRKKTKIFGQLENEINDDDLLEKLNSSQPASKSVDVVEIDENTPPEAAQSQNQRGDSVLKVLSPGERILFAKLMELQTDIKVLQKTLVQMEVKNILLDASNNSKKQDKLGVIKDEKLQRLDLPLEDEIGITGFDSKLKSKNFYDEVVSQFTVAFLCHFLYLFLSGNKV